mgnify:CR=1 FL=1
MLNLLWVLGAMFDILRGVNNDENETYDFDDYCA